MKMIHIMLLTLFFILSQQQCNNKDDNTQPQLQPIAATVETEPVPSSGDAADDPSIWIHPSDPSLSIIIGTDSNNGIAVYNLDGLQLQYISGDRINNQDLRYNFPLSSEFIDIVVGSKLNDNSIAVYKVNSETRQLENIAARTIITGLDPIYGMCMYHSSITNDYYAIAISSWGNVEQWRLYDDGSGKVDATMVRTFSLNSAAEGCVADDELGNLYISEEHIGIWKYGAEPTSGTTGILIAPVSDVLKPDIEGLTIYRMADGLGYLIASSQGSDSYVVFGRVSNDYVATFKIGPNNAIGIDGTSHTDGIDITNFPLGLNFPYGVFVVQDNENTDPAANQNFKLVPWERIALNLNLAIDTTINPRQ